VRSNGNCILVSGEVCDVIIMIESECQLMLLRCITKEQD